MPYRYKAFISYSHAADARLAPALQSALQRFAKPWFKLRAMRVFRDTTGLAVTPQLWPAIQAALEQSEFFILLASPQAAQSQWVEQEVDWWLSHRNSNTLLIVCTDGNLVWGGTDYDWAKSDALPQRLKGAFNQEPLYLDLRWARSSVELSLRHPRFLDAIARVAATLYRRPLDDLIGSDVREQRRSRLLVRAAATLLTVVTATSLWALFTARQAIQHQRKSESVQAKESESRRLAAIAEEQIPVDKELAILLALEALKIQPNTNAESVLRRSLVATNEATRSWQAHEGKLLAAGFNTNGSQFFTIANDKTLRVWKPTTGQMLRELPLNTPSINYAVFDSSCNRLMTLTSERGVSVWDAATGKELFAFQLSEHEGTEPFFSPDGNQIVTHGDGLFLRNANTGEKLKEFETDRQVLCAAISPDGKRVASDSMRFGMSEGPPGPIIYDLRTGRMLPLSLPEPARQVDPNAPTRMEGEMHFSPDGQLLLIAGATARLWRVDRGIPVAELNFGVAGVAFSPDGRFVITGSIEHKKNVYIWEAATGQKIVDLDATVNSWDTPVWFGASPNGKCLATYSDGDDRLLVWETASGVRLADLTGIKEEVRLEFFDFIPGTPAVIAVDEQGVARIFDCEISGSMDDLVMAARKHVKRQLTPDELRHFAPGR